MSIRVFLADDHRMMRDALRTIVEKDPDIEVVGECDDGRQAVEAVRELSPDIVVIDIAMPELNGIECTARMLQRNSKLKVIGLSAYSDKRYVLEMLNAGATGYVTKSSAGTELLRAIRTVAAGQSYLCPAAASAVVARVTEHPGTKSAPAPQLGRREREVLQMIAEGRRSPEIAERLCLSVATIDSHRRNIMRKLGVHTIAGLTKYAIREGLTTSQ